MEHGTLLQTNSSLFFSRNSFQYLLDASGQNVWEQALTSTGSCRADIISSYICLYLKDFLILDPFNHLGTLFTSSRIPHLSDYRDAREGDLR